MTSYFVLASPGACTPDERSVVIPDRFSWLAFLAPVIWLLFNRLWLEALGAALVSVAASWLAGSAGLAPAAVAMGLALQLLTGLEGRNWRAAALQRRGWRLVDLVQADDPDTAFEIHAARAAAQVAAPATGNARANRLLAPQRRPRDADTGAIGLVSIERN